MDTKSRTRTAAVGNRSAMKGRMGILLLSGLWAVAPAAWGQRNLKEIPDPDPKLQLAELKPEPGLKVNLFAADPMVSKPINMNWDAEGRLWVVSSPIYPQIKPGQIANDRVIVLEDADRDGVAEKSTVFAEGLHIPTAVMPVDGGVWVANSTELLFLEDKDGDLKEDADGRKIVLSGFGTEDTHHILHTFGRGPGGNLYMNQSIYIHSHIETPHGVRRLMGGGIWHFRPETRRLEVLAKGLVNSWGFAFDRWGQSFATDGAGGDGINFIFPGFVGVTSPGAPRVIRGLNPGQPKQCGLCVVESSAFPESWRGSLVTCDFRGGRLNRFVLKDNGSSYISEKAGDPLVSTHRAFRPIDAKVGPDGALYIADWYNPIIQHGEVDFRDPRRDHEHGRIWRLTAEDLKAPTWPDFGAMGTGDLVGLLGSPEGQVRHFARMELHGREKGEVARALDAWVQEGGEGAERDYRRMESLWIHQGLTLDESPAEEIVRLSWAGESRLRAAALRVLYHRLIVSEMPEAMGILERSVADDDARVRLWAVCCLRQIGTPEALEVALRVLDSPMDNNIDFALEAFARDSRGAWLAAYQKGDVDFDKDAGHLVFAMKAAGGAEAFGPLMGALEAGGLAPGEAANVVGLLGSVGNPGQLAQLAEKLGDTKVPQGALMDALSDAAAKRKAVPAGNGAKEKLLALLPGFGGEEKGKAARLAGYWKLGGARSELVGMLDGEGATATAAAEALARLGGGESVAVFERLAGAEDDPAKRALGVVGRTMMNAGEGAKLAARVLADLKTSGEAAPIFEAFLRNKQGPAILAKALEGTKVDAAVATSGIQRAGSVGGNTAPLIEALKKAGGVKSMDRKLDAEEMAALVAKVNAEGDPARGEAVYRRAELLCAACHAIGETGGLTGPNLVSIGASAPVDYLIDSLLDPNKKIKEGYHMTTITTKDGGALSGGIEREDDREVVVRDAAGQLHPVAKDQIATRSVSPVSMMPVGLTAQLREDEFVDLVRFLAELGKEGDFKVKPNAFVRNWRVLGELDAGQLDRIGHLGLGSLGVDDPAKPFFNWAILYSKVDGSLPLSEVPINWGRGLGISAAQFELEVGKPGKVGVEFENTQAVRFFVGDKEVKLEGKRAVFEVAEPGRVKGTLVIARKERPDGDLRAEVVEVEGGAAVKPVMR